MSPSATLETTGLSIEAGGVAAVPLTLSNDGTIVDEYRFRLVGPLAPWGTVVPETISVYPGSSATVTVDFRLPRSAEVPAGNVPYGVQVLPTEDADEPVVAEGMIEVRPFFDTRAELVPRTSEGRNGGRHRVAVDNRGNATIDARLVATDPEERLRLGVRPPELRVGPGTVQLAELEVRPVARIWRGARTSHPFTVSVESEQGPGVVLAGTHRQDPLLPRWSVKAAVVGAVLVLLTVLVVFAVSAVGDLVSGAIQRVEQLLGGAGVGGEDREQDQEAEQDPQQDQDGEGAAAEERVTADLTATAEPGQVDQDVDQVVANGTVFTSVVLSTSDGDSGFFSLSVGGFGLATNVPLEQIQGGQQEFPLDPGVAADAGQQIQLALECVSADDELLQVTDACEVTARLEGVVVPQGG